VERLGKFSLELEAKKTRLVEFGRFALRMTKEEGKRLKTIYFLGFTHFCTRNRKGNFMVGRKTEKSRFRRSIQGIQSLMREIRHYSLREQGEKINQVLRGHYAYYGVGGNLNRCSRFIVSPKDTGIRCFAAGVKRAILPGKDFNPLNRCFRYSGLSCLSPMGG
jgi:RNA-directed DNA polymerase